jgi:cytochrome c oxidase subunit II
VVGFQWQWQFSYGGTPVVVTGVPGKDPVLVLPTGRTVRLELSSPDVVHSFWVPHFIEKRDLIPRVDNAIDVRVTQPGQWAGVCSEFCGLDHTKMRFRVQAVPGPQFDSWLASGGTTPL